MCDGGYALATEVYALSLTPTVTSALSITFALTLTLIRTLTPTRTLGQTDEDG